MQKRFHETYIGFHWLGILGIVSSGCPLQSLQRFPVNDRRIFWLLLPLLQTQFPRSRLLTPNLLQCNFCLQPCNWIRPSLITAIEYCFKHSKSSNEAIDCPVPTRTSRLEKLWWNGRCDTTGEELRVILVFRDKRDQTGFHQPS